MIGVGLGYMVSGTFNRNSPPTSSTAGLSVLWFVTTTGANIFSSASSTGGNCDIGLNMSKNPIIIPMPNADNFGFDIGFTDSETISINTTSVSASDPTGFAMTLRNLFRKQTGVSASYKNKPLVLLWGSNTFYVLPRGLQVKQESGAGDIVNVSVQLEVVKWS